MVSTAGSGICTSFCRIVWCWRLTPISALAISSGGSVKSATPARIADSGMLVVSADSSWTNVMPPAALMAFNPSVPSLAAPDNITPIELACWSSAKEIRKRLIGKLGCSDLTRGCNWSLPFLIVSSVFSGMIYTLLGWTSWPSFISVTGSLVVRASNSTKPLLCFGSKCCTNTNAMPLLVGRACKNCVYAFSPPAEAPTPTTGNPSLRRGLMATDAIGFIVLLDTLDWTTISAFRPTINSIIS